MPMPGGAQRQPSSYLQGGQGLECPAYGVPQLTGHMDSLLGCLHNIYVAQIKLCTQHKQNCLARRYCAEKFWLSNTKEGFTVGC